MKRSSSVELEHEAKRRRIDATEDLSTKSLEGEAQVMDTADPVSTIRPDVNAGDAMEITNAGTTIQDLPPEILGNHIFKFFDFTYWLKSFVTVSKYWQLAAVQSTVDKQLRIRKMVGTAWCTISRYRVSTLIFKRHAYLFEVATLINASPRIRSVKFNCAPVAYDFLPATKFSFNNVSTLFLPASELRLLRFFPNVTQVCFSGSYQNNPNVSASSVQELALPETSPTKIKKLLEDIKITFPAVHTIYFMINDRLINEAERKTEEEIKEELEAISTDLGISLVYGCTLVGKETIGGLPNISYEDYFNCIGRTAFCNSLDSLERLHEVLKKFPTLTVEYEQDFITRERQFVFPRIKSKSGRLADLSHVDWERCNKEILKTCYEKNMLPPRGLIWYHMEQKNYKAILTLKSFLGVDHTQMLLAQAPSLVQLSNDLGAETFKQIITEDSLRTRIDNDDFSYEDLTPIKDQLSDEIVKYMYKWLLRELRSDIDNSKWQYLVQFDSWLHPATSRQIDNQPCIGVQYLSDEAQAKHFKALLKYRTFEEVVAEFQNISKPFDQLFHKGNSLLLKYTRNLTQVVQKFNVDVNQPDMNGITPLIHAIGKGDERQVLELLQLGADPNFAGNSLLPLNYCLLNNASYSIEIINALVAYGADINRRDYDSKGRTAWPITSALARSFETMRFLLHLGADPTVIDEAGNTLLHLLFHDKLNISPDNFMDLLQLLATQININQKNQLGEAVLHRAISRNVIKPIHEAVINCGADVNLPDAHGRTPLQLACETDAAAGAFKALLATNKVDIKARSKDGESFVCGVFKYMQKSLAYLMKDEELMAICQPYLTEDNLQFIKDECKRLQKYYHRHNLIASNIVLAKFFVELGYKVGNHSFDLLHSLAITNPEKSEIFDYLLANGLDINGKNSRQETALLAEMRKIPVAKKEARKIQFLLKHGASVTEKDSQGIAPIDIDPLIETRYANGLHIDYFYASKGKKLPDLNFVELRQKKNDF